MPSDEKIQNLEFLIMQIQEEECTPFLGAGTCCGKLPLGSEIAKDWANKYNYPLMDSSYLTRVAQYLAIRYRSPTFPKSLIIKQIKEANSPDFWRNDEPHGFLADLPLPVYITTNYDNFMEDALKSRKKTPRTEVCRWNKNIPNDTVFDGKFEPDVQNPVVFHLHGHISVKDSLVLTEDDYLDFIINISKDQEIIPSRIQQALTTTSLLFLGYRIADWNFRVIFRGLLSYLELSTKRSHVSVQLLPKGDIVSSEQEDRAKEYVDEAKEYIRNYFGKNDIHIHWDTCQDFVRELRNRGGFKS